MQLVFASRVQAQSAANGDPVTWNAESQEMFGYLEAVFANANAIRSGDCLLRIEENFDSVNFKEEPSLDGVLDHHETWMRVRFDYDARKAAMALGQLAERTDLGLEDPGLDGKNLLQSKRHIMAYCINPEIESTFSFSRGHFEGKRYLDPDSALDKIRARRFPELRALGWTGGTRTEYFTLFKSWMRVTESGQHLFTVNKRTQNHVEFRKYVYSKWDSDIEQEYTDFRINLDSLTIASTKSYHHYGKERPGVVHVSSPLIRYQWIEVSDVQVPIHLNYSTYQRKTGVSGKRLFGDLSYRMDIHWFSVNEPIDPSAFDGSEIKTVDLIEQLVDPKKSNATTLIDLADQGKPVKAKPSGEKVQR